MRQFALIACLIGSPAAADGPVTWSELLAPERLAKNIAQSLALTIRSFVDITYTALDVDIRRGAVTMRNIKASPLIQATDFAHCDVEVRRLEIVGAGLARPDDIKVTLRADDIRVLNTCLLPPAAGVLEAAGLTNLQIPRAVFQIAYHVPSASAQITGFAVADDLAELSLNVDLDYFWIDAAGDEPYPVIYLDRADATFQNLGLWNFIRDMLPPDAVNPEVSPATLQIGAAQALVEAGAGEPFAVALSTQMAEAWSAFLTEPEILAVALEPGEPQYVDLDSIEKSLGEILVALSPTVSALPVTRVTPLPAILLRTALSAPTTLSAEERLLAGRQLITGIGAPRNVTAGLNLLLPLAIEGDEGALKVIAALDDDAFRASNYATVAEAAVGQPNVTALLDGIEARISFAETLGLQQPLETAPSFDGIATAKDLRSRSLAYLEGSRAPRSFARAAYWAQLAAAAGDYIANDILADISGRIVTEEDKTAWEAVERDASFRALEDWIGADLPSILSSQ